MKVQYVLAALVCVLMLATTATAATVNLSMSDLAGWSVTATNVYGGSPNASVTVSTNYGTDNFKFMTGPMNTSWQFQWAGISTDAFAGTKLSALTSMKIKSYGISGDSSSWQPPTFTLVVDKGDVDGNQRCLTWKPWANGNARTPGVWKEYDAATTGQWLLEETGVYYNSLAALQAALPNAYFEYTAQLPASLGYASQQAFNVGNCPLYDGDRSWFTGASGYVDWFEVGVNGNVTRYDLVPEPSSIAALCMGLVGLLGIRRRK